MTRHSGLRLTALNRDSRVKTRSVVEQFHSKSGLRSSQTIVADVEILLDALGMPRYDGREFGRTHWGRPGSVGEE